MLQKNDDFETGQLKMEVTDENYDIFSPKEKDEIKALHSSKKNADLPWKRILFQSIRKLKKRWWNSEKDMMYNDSLCLKLSKRSIHSKKN